MHSEPSNSQHKQRALRPNHPTAEAGALLSMLAPNAALPLHCSTKACSTKIETVLTHHSTQTDIRDLPLTLACPAAAILSRAQLQYSWWSHAVWELMQMSAPAGPAGGTK